MLILPDEFVAILEQASIGEDDLLVALVELTIPKVPPSKGTETIYYAFSEHDVTFAGQLYSAWNGNYDRIDNRSDGEQPSFGLQISNVDQTWSKKINDLHLQKLNLNASEVTIRIISLALLSATDNDLGFSSGFSSGFEVNLPLAVANSAQIAYENMAVSGYSVNSDFLELNITTPFNALSLRVPRYLLGGKRDAENEVPGGPQRWFGWPYGLQKIRK